MALLTIVATGCSSPSIPQNVYCFVVDGGSLPACGVDGVTYANDSYAVCAGVGVAHEGACGAPSTRDAGADGSGAVEDADGIEAANDAE